MVQIASITVLSVALLAGQAFAAGAVIGRIAAGVASGVAQGVVSNNSKMRRVVRSSTADAVVTSAFSNCMNNVEESSIRHIINPDHSVIVTGLPPVCITEVKNYNTLSNIAFLNEVQGVVAVVNSSTIKVSGLPSALSDYLESLGQKH